MILTMTARMDGLVSIFIFFNFVLVSVRMSLLI